MWFIILWLINSSEVIYLVSFTVYLTWLVISLLKLTPIKKIKWQEKVIATRLSCGLWRLVVRRSRMWTLNQSGGWVPEACDPPPWDGRIEKSRSMSPSPADPPATLLTSLPPVRAHCGSRSGNRRRSGQKIFALQNAGHARDLLWSHQAARTCIDPWNTEP